MSHQICPLCNGSGRMSYDPFTLMNLSINCKCIGCDGLMNIVSEIVPIDYLFTNKKQYEYNGSISEQI